MAVRATCRRHVDDFLSQVEFDNALLHMDLKDTITIRAVIGHLEFASHAVEDVGNSTRVKIHRRVFKIGLCCGEHSATVAIDLNGVFGRENVLDVCRVGK